MLAQLVMEILWFLIYRAFCGQNSLQRPSLQLERVPQLYLNYK